MTVKKFMTSPPKISLSIGKINLSKPKPIEEYDLQEESKKEVGESLRKIRENEAKFKKELDLETETDFYFSVVFESKEEMHNWLNKHGIALKMGAYIFKEDLDKKMVE